MLCLGQIHQEVKPNNVPIPLCVMQPPNVNAARMLKWYRPDGMSLVSADSISIVLFMYIGNDY